MRVDIDCDPPRLPRYRRRKQAPPSGTAQGQCRAVLLFTQYRWGEAVEQGGGHFRIAKDTRPFAKGQISGHDDRCALREEADQGGTAVVRRSGRRAAEFVENDEVEAREIVGEPPLAGGAPVGL